MAGIREAIYRVVAAERPMTVRQVFYRMVSQGVIAKTEAEYGTTICRLLVEMRVSGEMPFAWIADNTRWMRKPHTESSIDAALQNTARAYRRDLWDNQESYVEVWCEKDALAGVLYAATEQYDVPLMITRGYPSISFVYAAAMSIGIEEKPCYLYYLGDHDPSGVDIPRNVEQRLREFAPEAEIYFERIAVTPNQIAEWDLPTRPTKRTDSRARAFDGESVEVDAIPPAQLREPVEDCIERQVDQRKLGMLRVAEASERELIKKMARELSEDKRLDDLPDELEDEGL